MSKKFLGLSTSLVVLLTACSSGGGGGSDDNYNATPNEIRELVRAVNDDFQIIWGSYQTTDQPHQTHPVRNGTIRFDTTQPIPLYFVSADGSSAPAAISQAVHELETRLGNIFTEITPVKADLSVFKDQGSPGNEEAWPSPTWRELDQDSGQTKGMKFLADHGLSYGIAIAVNTGYLPAGGDPSNYCANASIAPYSGALWIHADPETHLVANDFVGWVNMGNGVCKWGKEMVKHELAHMLGMYHHHYQNDIFGLWSDTALDILATLYANPAGTDFSELVVSQQ